MALPQGWKQSQDKPNIYEANIKQINIPTGTVPVVAEVNKTTGSYTVYSTSGINFIGGRTPIYTKSASGALSIDPRSKSLYDTLKRQGDIIKLDNSIKPRAFEINQTFGTDNEKNNVKNSSEFKSLANQSTTPTDDEKKLTAEFSEENELSGTRNEFMGSGGSDPLKYPLTLKNEYQDVIKFKMVKYRPKKFDRSQIDRDLNAFSARTEGTIIGTVVLPIPSGINDTNAVNWGSDTLDPLKSNLANIAETAITQGFSKGADVAGRTAENVGANASDVQTGLANAFVQAATQTSNLLSRTRGAVFNPNMELLFQGPTLRPFTFNFKLSARNAQEAKAIRSIIRFFKQGMSPIRTKSQLFLRAPHTFQIEYLHMGKSHSFLNKFKECALQSFSVDYTPEGQYATFTDGAMVSYQIQMQFQELEPIFNDDYTKGTGSSRYDTEIGY